MAISANDPTHLGPPTYPHSPKVSDPGFGETSNLPAWKIDGLHKVLLAMLQAALYDLRYLKGRCDLNGPAELNHAELRRCFQPAVRGRFIQSALFVLDIDGAWDVPPGMLSLARALLNAEMGTGWLVELTAAAACDSGWKQDFAKLCLRCGTESCSWRPVLAAPKEMAEEMAWRYRRPENHAPICRRCAHVVGWPYSPKSRRTLAITVWGRRFLAFERWHQAAVAGTLPKDWDKLQHPLWPPAYGGPTWIEGSGALQDAEPQPPFRFGEDSRTPPHRLAAYIHVNSADAD